MKVCFFGTYEKDYSSNRIIIKGLERSGTEVVECHKPLWEKYKNKNGNFLKIFSLLKMGIRLLKAYHMLFFQFFKKCKKIDIFIVGYIGQLDIIFLKFLLLFKKNKPKIIFIPLVSLYDTAIIDRGLSKKNNLFAKFLFYLDKISFKIVDLVIFDTNEHINYICKIFNLDKDRFKRVWVGADEEVFYPIERKKLKKECHSELVSESDISSDITLINNSSFSKENNFQVLFYGKYIPLHGIEYIIKAAKLLEHNKDVKFKIIGNGQLYNRIRSLSDKLDINNIDFIEWVEYNELVNEINKADVALGIFGGTDKSSRVIPNKVFQAIACKKPVITGDTLAIRELFKNKKNILFCENRNPESLKSVILMLKNNKKLREKIAENSYILFKNEANIYKIGKAIEKLIIELKI